MEPHIQYAKTSDGVSIAYAALGDGPPIVFTPTVWGDLHLYTSSSSGHQKTDAMLERGWQVVLYDGRGCGYSERSATDFSLETWLNDLDAVVGARGVERLVICGRVASSLTAIAYAAQHPERVSHLALINPHSRGADLTEGIPAMRATKALMSAVAAEQWEYFTLNLANAISGFSDSERARRQAAIYRTAMSPETYLAQWEAMEVIDVTPLLTSVRAPTLVVHDKSDTFFDFSALARNIASQIAGARLVSSEDPPAAVDQFLRESGDYAPSVRTGFAPATAAPSLASGMTAIILFADIADSTALTERLGDAAFRDKARELDEALRRAITSNGGTAIDGKLLGDGVLATFGAAREAIACAAAIHDAGSHAGLPLHVGIHAGDVIRERGSDGRDNVYGGAVNIAARVAGEAAAGETLVSATVRELARTSAGVSFEDRGERELKGVADTVRVFAVRSEA